MMTEYTLFATLAFHHVVIGSLLTAILYLFNRLFKTSAEMLSWIWMTAFFIVTLLPFTLFTNPSSQLIKQPTAYVETVNSSENIQPKISQSERQNEIVLQKKIATTSTDTSFRLWNFPSELVFQFSQLLAAFILIWFSGSLWRGYSVFSAYLRTKILIRSALPLQQNEIFEDIRTADSSRLLKNEILISAFASSPMVVGVFSPKIIVPKHIINELNIQQLMPILLHEQAHIQRYDIWFGFFQELIAIVFWWSPVIRILNHKIHIQRELACDLRAASQLRNNKQYAQSLIDCAKLMITQKRSVLAMGLFSQKKELSARIGEVLKNKAFKQPSLISIAGMCLVMSFGSIQATQNLAPKISFKQATSDAKRFSLLSERDTQELIRAVVENDLEAIKQLHQEGVDLDTPAIGDGTAMMIAVKKNRLEVLNLLFELGADVNQASRGDGNPLTIAANTNNIELTQWLLEHGAEVDAGVKGDGTALIIASKRGNTKVAELLLNYGAKVNRGYRGDGNPLIMAAANNNIQLAELFVAQGADVNAIVPGDETPLINATRNGHLAMTKFLVGQGADVNLAVETSVYDGSKIRTPLNMASSSAIKNYLIQQGATE